MKFGEPKPEEEIRKAVVGRLDERAQHFEEHGKVLRMDTPNYDPILRRDYEAIFRKLINPGDTILAVAVGSFDHIGDVNYQVPALMDVTKEKGATLLLNDILHENLLTHKDNKELRQD